MRLTNEIRQQVIDTVIAKQITPDLVRLKELLEALAQDIADNRYPPKIREWLAQAPAGGVQSKGRVSIGIGDTTWMHELVKDPRQYRDRPKFTLKNPLRVIHKDSYTDTLYVPKSSPLAKRLRAIQKDLDALARRKGEITDTVGAALAACNTRKQLIETYPELEAHLPEPEPKTTALAVTRQKVAKVLRAA